jgi:hypothetical protein
MVLFINACNSQTFKMQSGIVYYKEFDIFKLKGTDTLKRIDKKQSVEVKYDKGVPVFIKFFKPDRTVTLVMEDSLSINHSPVYIYATSNFHGGQPGKNKEYSFRYKENKDLLYINLSDTVICKSHEVTKLDYYSYTLYLYLQNKDGGIVEYISGSNTKEDNGFSKQELYLNWLKLLMNDYLKGERKPEIKQSIPE